MVTIKKQGLFDTLQDDGRYGYQHLGIHPCGVMDNIASSVANILVGNLPNETIIELHFPAAVLVFESACIIALSGADFGATINDELIPLNTAVIIGASSVLECKKQVSGARCYVAVRGGWQANEWLNSSSTDTVTGLGGNILKKGDVLHYKKEQQPFKLTASTTIVTNINIATKQLYNDDCIRFIDGPEYHSLTNSSKEQLAATIFTISSNSNRMGYRLKGISLTASMLEIISSAVTKGTIQLLPDGQLIVLMADHQTTGGYPRIAQVIMADIPMLAQRPLLSTITFRQTTLEEAEQKYFMQQQYLQQTAVACNFQLKQFFE